MSYIYYRVSGTVDWVVIREASAEESVACVKEYVSRNIIDINRIYNGYIMYEPNRKTTTNQIECYGDENVTISCVNAAGYPDAVGLAQCLMILGFELDEDEQKGNFRIGASGCVCKEFSKK